jgi:hypothetical protein
MRRKSGVLLPLERAVCVAAVDLAAAGIHEFHGYVLAGHLANIADRRLLTAYGTLYRTLGRMEKMGLLTSQWEDPMIPARENRPGRRLYTLTAAGVAVVRERTWAPTCRTRRTVAPAAAAPGEPSAPNAPAAPAPGEPGAPSAPGAPTLAARS